MIESVKIIHDWKHIKEYRFWADFFRWTGTQVREYTLKNEDFSSDFTFVMILKEGMSDSELEKLNHKYSNSRVLRVSADQITAGTSLEMKTRANCTVWKDYMRFYLNKICEKKLIPSLNEDMLKEDINILTRLGVIYIDDQICYHRNAYSCFYENEEIVQNAQDAFVNAYIKICDISNKLPKTGSYYYVKANLIRYMDETCRFLKQQLLLPVEKGLKFLDEALRVNPSFSNANLLKGILSELDIKYIADGKEFYDKAMEGLSRTKYSSYPRYLQARYHEKVLKDYAKSLELYADSIEKDLNEYRAIYKLAMADKKERNYSMAEEKFKKIYNILKDKEEVDYLQPREYEYLFKAYLELSKIYSYEGFDLDKYKEMVVRREALCDRIFDTSNVQNKAYEEIFGTQAENFRKETYKRFKTTVMKCE